LVIKLEAAEAAPVRQGYEVDLVIDAHYPVTALSVNKYTNQVAACCDLSLTEADRIGYRRSRHRLPNSQYAKSSAPADQCVFVWDSDKVKPRHILHNNSDCVTTLHWHPLQEKYPYLVTGSKDKTITILNPNKVIGRKERVKLSDDAMGEVRAVAWHPAEDTLVSLDGKDVLRIWQPFNWGQKLQCTVGPRGPISTINVAGWNTEGDIIISGGDQEVILWDAQKGHRRVTKNIGAVTTAFDWQADSPNCFVTGCEKIGSSQGFLPVSITRALLLWDRKSMPRVGFLTGHESKITSVKFNPAFPYELISASEDGTIRSWDLRTLTELDVRDMRNVRRGSALACLQVLQEHTDAVTSVDFYSSQGEHKFAFGSSDKTIRVIAKSVLKEVPDRTHIHDRISREEKEEEAARQKEPGRYKSCRTKATEREGR
jgi:WD40 repeat protein